MPDLSTLKLMHIILANLENDLISGKKWKEIFLNLLKDFNTYSHLK